MSTEVLVQDEAENSDNTQTDTSINMNAEKESFQSEEFKAAFKIFDKNGDGKISAEELLIVFTSLGLVKEIITMSFSTL